MNLPAAAVAFGAAFLAGSIPTAYLLVKILKGKDIRTMGSGNAGATNVFRCVGFKEGLAALLLDAAKGAVPVLIFTHRPDPIPAVHPDVYGFLLALTAILGHVFTPFLGFKGGKGVAVGAGVATALYPWNFLVAFMVWAVVLAATRYMSLASLLGTYTFAIVSFLTPQSLPVRGLCILAAFFITWTHRSNIRRLLKGEELRLNINRKNS